MNDREMLELAAKAGGIKAYWSTDGSIQQHPIFVVKSGGGMGTMPYEEEWNPLTDDGDALRLAVKLGMYLNIYTNPETAITFVGVNSSKSADEKHSLDPYSATRRAIVRAAAEIGRTM